MEPNPDPAYRRPEPRDRRWRYRWVRRAALLGIVALTLLSSDWAIAAVFVALWIGTELLEHRQRGRRPGEGAG
ncbi:MAG: hypothetical protein JWO02_4010 [Solirubrobacterales bacterium]|nr:hypothetical protein [Solirubrobacterales bacterium]